jgi:hypothetical protein
MTRDVELRDLRRRYAELTGKKLEEDVELVSAPPAEAPVPLALEAGVAVRITKTPISPDKRTRVAEAAKRASAPRTQHAQA